MKERIFESTSSASPGYWVAAAEKQIMGNIQTILTTSIVIYVIRFAKTTDRQVKFRLLRLDVIHFAA